MITTYEQAKRLEALGFKDWTFNLYDKDLGTKHYAFDEIISLNASSDYYKAPLISESLDFIREEKGVLCAVELFRKTNRFGSLINYKYSGAYIGDDNKEVLLKPRRTNPEAENALLNALLDYLESRIN